MSRTVFNALKATAVLVIITAVCVGALALCNMFFPKYVPTLDGATAKLINEICPTGVSDDIALSDGYIELLGDDDYGVKLADYNKANKSAKAEILAVYRQSKGDNAGAFIIEAKSSGRDGDVVVLTAYKNENIVGATVKKQGESYWNKLPTDMFESLVGENVYSEIDLSAKFGKTGATLSLTAVNRAVNISNSFAKEHNRSIVKPDDFTVYGHAKESE